jgi:hypothetical protein
MGFSWGFHEDFMIFWWFKGIEWWLMGIWEECHHLMVSSSDFVGFHGDLRETSVRYHWNVMGTSWEVTV